MYSFRIIQGADRVLEPRPWERGDRGPEEAGKVGDCFQQAAGPRPLGFGHQIALEGQAGGREEECTGLRGEDRSIDEPELNADAELIPQEGYRDQECNLPWLTGKLKERILAAVRLHEFLRS